MIKIGILGDIGSESSVAKTFGYPVFNADNEVSELYRKDRGIFIKLKKKLPNYIFFFPIKKRSCRGHSIKQFKFKEDSKNCSSKNQKKNEIVFKK